MKDVQISAGKYAIIAAWSIFALNIIQNIVFYYGKEMTDYIKFDIYYSFLVLSIALATTISLMSIKYSERNTLVSIIMCFTYLCVYLTIAYVAYKFTV
jgi:glucan phosphoethanolaminetransferase (alkaline phosphatase superfamily)